MSLASQNTQQKFPFSYDLIMDCIEPVLSANGFSVKSIDKVIGRVTASSGMSVFSYGENITLVIEKIDETSTLVQLESALKVGFNFAGAGRHQKNFNKIIASLSKKLQESQ